MKEFLLVYRMDFSTMPDGTPEEKKSVTKKWMDWIGGIAARNKLAEKGNRLTTSGKVLNNKGVLSDGPYTEIKESIGGYSVIKAASYEEAAEIAKECPILSFGGNVEIREISEL